MADSPDRDELAERSADEATAEAAAESTEPNAVVENTATEDEASEEHTPDARATDEHASEGLPEEQASEEQASEEQALEEQASEGQVPDEHVAEPDADAEAESEEPGERIGQSDTDVESAEPALSASAVIAIDADATADADGSDADLGRATADLKSIVEALIFASPEPLTPKALMKLLDSEPKEDVLAALDAVKTAYERPGGLQIVEVAGGFQIVTRPDLHEWVRRLFHERSTQKLSVQALETLAVIAYRQPITALEITEIRGVSASGVLNTLLERHLVKIVGRKQVVGRPFMYATTKEFLIRFGLKDISDLPKVEDMAESLGIDSPLLVEQTPPEEQLPLSEPETDDAGSDQHITAIDEEPLTDDPGDPIN